MNRKIWDVYAPVYKRAMRAYKRAYSLMYRRIPKVIRGKKVLEIATGPELLVLHVAPTAKEMIGEFLRSLMLVKKYRNRIRE